MWYVYEKEPGDNFGSFYECETEKSAQELIHTLNKEHSGIVRCVWMQKIKD